MPLPETKPLALRRAWIAVLTCDRTTTPSAERCTSVSRACAPTSTAPWKAAMVFSGHKALAPRWAMACGRRRAGSRGEESAAAHGAVSPAVSKRATVSSRVCSGRSTSRNGVLGLLHQRLRFVGHDATRLHGGSTGRGADGPGTAVRESGGAKLGRPVERRLDGADQLELVSREARAQHGREQRCHKLTLEM